MSGNSYHTHTVYCDGRDTPEELVLCAISKGCAEIGFSGHSYTDIPDDSPFCMSKENTAAYKREILRLKEVYRDRIRILMGIEQDYYSEEKTDDYDYVIGSVHYVYKDGCWLPVDASAETQRKAVREHYNGDFYGFVEDYYSLAGDVYRRTKCDIIGHFDLITKFNEGNRLFDTGHPRYIRAANGALEKLLQFPARFEVNYGAIARGYRKTPYPEERIRRILLENGRELLPTSDCHRKEQLLFGIE